MKPWYLSKTIWVNLIGAVAFFLQSQYGYVVDPAVQIYILTAVNGILRFISNQKLSLT